MASIDVRSGDVVLMKSSSGMKGYGNVQCVSSVSIKLGCVSLYGHNEHYKIHDVAKVVLRNEEFTIPKLSDLFPFEYKGAGYFRLKGIPVGVDAEILHGMQAIEYLYSKINDAKKGGN